MLKISAKAEYACLALLALAQRGGDQNPVRIREIAGRYGIPERYLVQILLQLKGSGLVQSTRGASGGYRLARSADTIRLSEVLTAIDGPLSPRRDTGSPADRALSSVWDDLRVAVVRVLEGTTLAELTTRNAPHEWVI